METILIVDDEKNYPLILSAVLQEEGFEPLMSHSGEEALEIIDHSDVDLVLTDMKMPKMDGLETLARIKEEHPLVEVIMLTGHATVESAIEGMKLGAFDYLMKPCDLDDLLAKVDDAAARKQGHEEKIIQARIDQITSRRD